MTGLMVSDVLAAEKQTLTLAPMKNYNQATGTLNVGQGHTILVRAKKVCDLQLQCKF